VEEPKPDNGGLSEVTNYTYDEEHRLLTVSMARGGYKNGAAGTFTQTRSFEYDAAGRTTKTTLPETGVTETHYDALGRVSWKLDARGRKTTYEYDSNARLQYVKRYLTASSAEDTAERTEYIYDGLTLSFLQGLNPPAVDFVQENGLGRVVAIKSGSNVVELMAYTDGGQLKRKRVIAEGQSMEVSYSYGTDGKVQSITYPSGRVLKYGYGAWGRPNSLQAADGYQYASAAVGWHERLVNLNAGPQSASWEGFEYNRLGQLTRWWSIPGRHITYDYEWPGGYNNGKLESQTDALQNRTVTYSYDLLGRLGSAVSTAGWVQTYQFDGFGNLYRKNSAGGAPWADWTALLNSEKNQVLEGAGFDAAGNHLWNTLVTYDYENRMRTSPGEGMGWRSSYDYSADNKRVVKRKTAFPMPSPQDTFEVTLWANGQRIAARTGGGVWTLREYVGFAGRRFSWTSVTGWPELEQADRVGSTVETLPFGEEMTASLDDKTKFATYWRDASTGLDYADQRYYTPGSGRFMTADPYQASGGPSDPGSWNRYSYVGGDPVNFNDPSGLAKAGLECGIPCVVTAPPPPGIPASIYGGWRTTNERTSGWSYTPLHYERDDQLSLIEDIHAEGCSLNEYIMFECEDGAGGTIAAAGLGRFGLAGAAAMAWVRLVGTAGERTVGRLLDLAKNTTPLRNTVSGTDRIPDFIRGETLIEVKNASYVAFTSQLRDSAAWAASSAGRSFELWMRTGARVSGTLQEAIDKGLITPRYFDWP